MALSQSHPSSTTTTTTTTTTATATAITASQIQIQLPQFQLSSSLHLISLEPSATTSAAAPSTLAASSSPTRADLKSDLRRSTTPSYPETTTGSSTAHANNLSTRQAGVNYSHRQSTLSTFSTKQNRAGLFTLAALAREKTTNAIASLSEPSVKKRPSYGSININRSSQGPAASKPSSSRSSSFQASPLDSQHGIDSLSVPQSKLDTLKLGTQKQALLETNPPSQAYADTATGTRPPITLSPQGNYNKMHQTSSRLLRMTNDDRPFTRVGDTIRNIVVTLLMNREGLQGSILHIGGQSSACTTSRPVDSDRAFICF